MPDQAPEPLGAIFKRAMPGLPNTPAAVTRTNELSPREQLEFNLRRARAYHALKTPHWFATAATDHPDVLAWVDRYLRNPRSAPSLLLLGPTGTGKTHAAYGALRAIAESGWPPVPWLSVTEGDLLREVRARDGLGDIAFDPYLAAPLLLLDDLGTSKKSEWTADVLRRLVERRYANNLPMIITTNLEIENDDHTDLPSVLGARTASRLAEITTCIAIDGPDRRYEEATR